MLVTQKEFLYCYFVIYTQYFGISKGDELCCLCGTNWNFKHRSGEFHASKSSKTCVEHLHAISGSYRQKICLVGWINAGSFKEDATSLNYFDKITAGKCSGYQSECTGPECVTIREQICRIKISPTFFADFLKFYLLPVDSLWY